MTHYNYWQGKEFNRLEGLTLPEIGYCPNELSLTNFCTSFSTSGRSLIRDASFTGKRQNQTHAMHIAHGMAIRFVRWKWLSLISESNQGMKLQDIASLHAFRTAHQILLRDIAMTNGRAKWKRQGPCYRPPIWLILMNIPLAPLFVSGMTISWILRNEEARSDETKRHCIGNRSEVTCQTEAHHITRSACLSPMKCWLGPANLLRDPMLLTWYSHTGSRSQSRLRRT